MATDCSLCAEIDGVGLTSHGAYAEIVETGSHILLETSTFVVVPSLGPLGNSHLLIVPRRHVLSFAGLLPSETADFLKVKERIRTYNSALGEPNTEFFEHGTGTESDFSCSCVQHAHMHALTAQQSICGRLRSDFEFSERSWVDVLSNVSLEKHGYYLIECRDGTVLVNTTRRLAQQFFRIAFAQVDGAQRGWNWRLAYDIPAIKAIISRYTALQH